MIEAMACETPVIAFRHGSVPEVVENEISGFVVDGEADALAALSQIERLNRRQVRQTFERRFTTRRMTNSYLQTYAGLLEGGQVRRADSNRVATRAVQSARSISLFGATAFGGTDLPLFKR